MSLPALLQPQGGVAVQLGTTVLLKRVQRGDRP